MTEQEKKAFRVLLDAHQKQAAFLLSLSRQVCEAVTQLKENLGKAQEALDSSQ